MAETPETPEEWLPILTARLDANNPKYRLLARYVNGDAPMPEMGSNVRQSWVKFQRMSRTNWGELIRDAVVDRIVPNGILIEGKNDSPEALQAKRIWRDNRLDTVTKDWLRMGLTFGKSYLTVWKDDEGKAIVTADAPDSMYAATDPLQPWRVRAAIRWWRDNDEEMDYAMVWSRSSWQRFSRSIYSDPNVRAESPIYTRAQGKWDADGPPTPTLSKEPPVIVYSNPGDCGEFENHLDLINRINHGTLQILAITAMQAFRQRGIQGGLLPQKDEQGNDIDWTKVFEAAPGALWNLPEGLDIWESQQTDVSPMLAEVKDHIRQLSAVTRTPFSTLIPDAANQSAEGAKEAKEGLIFKSGERLAVASVGIEAALVKALAVEGTELSDDQTLELLFEPVSMVTLAEKYQAANMAKAAGESWASIARNILGYTPEQIAQDALDRSEELLAGMAVAQQIQTATGQNATGQNAAGPKKEQPAIKPPPTNGLVNAG